MPTPQEKKILDIIAGNDWFDGVPPQKAQEWVSLAYLQGIIAQAGLNIANLEWDDGVDLLIGGSKPLAAALPRNFYLALQVKCTKQWEIRDNTVVYNLEKTAYDKLRERSDLKQLLVLYTLPSERSNWICSNATHNCFNNLAYWYDLTDAPINNNATGVTIYVPVANCLTCTSLIKIVTDLAKEKGYIHAA